MKRLLNRSAAILIGIIAAVVLIELAVGLTVPMPAERAGVELALFRGDQTRTRQHYTLDDELAFRPVLGTDLFDEHGFFHSQVSREYRLEDRRGRQRVLFMGDSVTFRGRLVGAIQEHYGDEHFEYWNGGVTAYNTIQEVRYFERYTHVCEPDHIVLTFHLNDFMRTPITFADSDGRMRVVMPHKNLSEIVPWLFRMSHIYRHWVAARRTPNAEEVQHDIREALQRLIAYTEAKGIRLSVLIHPVLKPRAEWNRHNVYRHEWIERTLEELGVRKFVLIEPLERALAEGVDPLQTPNDYEHPSHEVSRYFAADLREKGLLEGP